MLCEKCLLGISNGQQSWLCPECRKFHNSANNTHARNYHLEKLVEKFKKINGIKMEDPPQGKNQSSRCNRLSSLVHQNLKKIARNACDSKPVSKSAVKEVRENDSGQNNLTEMDNSSLGINEVTHQQGGQMNRPILNRSILLVEVHTLEFLSLIHI